MHKIALVLLATFLSTAVCSQSLFKQEPTSSQNKPPTATTPIPNQVPKNTPISSGEIRTYWAKNPVFVYNDRLVLDNSGLISSAPPDANAIPVYSQLGPRWIRIHPSDIPSLQHLLKGLERSKRPPYVWLGNQPSAVDLKKQLENDVNRANQALLESRAMKKQAQKHLDDYKALFKN